jgi:spermidine synthase
MTRTPILLGNVLVIAVCGLIYELQAATLSSFVLGDSVTQYSIIIGLYLSAMGVGAWLSGFLERELTRSFLEIELAVALVGGLSVPVLYLLYTRPAVFLVLLYGTVLVVGTLVGLELPLLMRIVRERLEFKDVVSRVLTFDYLGALVASLLFPLFFLPQLGLVRTSLITGIINATVGLLGTWLLAPLLERPATGLRIRAVLLILFLGIVAIQAERIVEWTERDLFDGEVAFAKTTPYQRIVVTTPPRGGFQLHLNAHLQFNSLDEYRYHEALAHPAMLSTVSPRRVLILGGGDGLALREVLRYPAVERVTVVDIDPAMTALSHDFPRLGELNAHAYDDPRVEVVNQDALIWLGKSEDEYDVAIIDFPDPHSYSLGKLYTTRFYRLLRSRLSDDASIGIQSTSPLTTRRSYWCIVRTLEASGFFVRPYQSSVPSFGGVWGYTLAKKRAFDPPTGSLPDGLRYLDEKTLAALFVMPPDLGPVEVKVNRLDNQQLVRYYESERRPGP